VDYRSAATAILEACESRVESVQGLAMCVLDAWVTAEDRNRALRAARKAGGGKTRALIIVGERLGFEDLFDEILAEVNAAPKQSDRDGGYGSLAAALSRRGDTDAALRFLRMIQSAAIRYSAVVDPDEGCSTTDPALIEEAFRALGQIEDIDRRALAGWIIEPLASVGRLDDALRLVAEADDAEQKSGRLIALAEGCWIGERRRRPKSTFAQPWNKTRLSMTLPISAESSWPEDERKPLWKLLPPFLRFIRRPVFGWLRRKAILPAARLKRVWRSWMRQPGSHRKRGWNGAGSEHGGPCLPDRGTGRRGGPHGCTSSPG